MNNRIWNCISFYSLYAFDFIMHAREESIAITKELTYTFLAREDGFPKRKKNTFEYQSFLGFLVIFYRTYS